MTDVKKFNIGPARREELDDLIRKVAKAHAVENKLESHAVEAKLDRRYTSKEGSYGAYERWLLSNGHTVYVSLDTMKATVSTKPDKHAIAKQEKRGAKAVKKAERKAANEAKIAEAKAKAEDTEPKAKKTRKPKIVKHDPKLPTI